LLDLDSKLLGWLFPKGQIALWLDASPLLNPSSLLGKLYCEVFQV